MRFELAGSIQEAKPLALPPFQASQDFDTLAYLGLGYTNFDVICIGGGGGPGGSFDTANTGTLIMCRGGEGGGGGFQRVQGVLNILPDLCPIVVGGEGAIGNDHNTNPALTTDGGDGGHSSFNDDLCQASGGKGGKRAQSSSDSVSSQAHGGEGGIGNRTIAGGGADGGTAGTPTPTGLLAVEGTDGVDGPIIDDIGHGGGGGAGGVGKYVSKVTCVAGTAGGRGSYNPDDLLVTGPGEEAYKDPLSQADLVAPGRGGGANATPLNGLPYIYGQAGTPGVVVVRLWAE